MPRRFSIRLIPVLCIAGLLAVVWTTSGLAASDSPDHDKAIAIWPGPDAVSTTFKPAESPIFYQGEGGTTKSVQGIDFWNFGRPSRVNRMLGTVTVKIAPLKKGQSPQLSGEDFNTLIEESAAKVASTAGASAAILMQIFKYSDGTVYCTYRLVVYLPEGAVADAPILKDATMMDADGNKVQNGSEVPIRTLRVPDLHKGDWLHVEASAFVMVCVGIDGAVTETSIITSSGHKELDAIALEAARSGKYSPATARDRPVSSCKDYKMTWKDH